MNSAALGLLGGTFDPVHAGHIAMARGAIELLGLSEVRLIPNRQPVHRAPPMASSQHRLAMLELAVEHEPGMVVDDLELRRAGPSWMIDTVTDIGRCFPDRKLVLLLGLDAFAGFERWRSWQALLARVHLLVFSRASSEGESFGQLTSRVGATMVAPGALLTQPAGRAALVAEFDLPVSATTTRRQILENATTSRMLGDSVARYIRNNGLYSSGL